MSECTSRDGKRKKRWPNAAAAWFLADLHSRGVKGVSHGLKLPYYCESCAGYHLFSVSSCADKRIVERGIERWRAGEDPKNYTPKFAPSTKKRPEHEHSIDE